MACPGFLAPLPVPTARLSEGSIDFITHLPICSGYNGIFTVVDRLTKFTFLIPCFVGEGALSAKQVALLFFDNVVRLFEIP